RLCVATPTARIEHNAFSPVFGWRSQEQACAQTQGQFAWYRAMEEARQMAQIADATGLERHLNLWLQDPTDSSPSSSSSPASSSSSTQVDSASEDESTDEDEGSSGERQPIGYILSLEGADS